MTVFRSIGLYLGHFRRSIKKDVSLATLPKTKFILIPYRKPYVSIPQLFHVFWASYSA